MYVIDQYKLGDILKQYRKSRNLTLEQLGEKINKNKATVSKYESNQIIPDILTILEICNVLDIEISQLFPCKTISKDSKNINPFNNNIIYLYYYTEQKLILSVIELAEQTDAITVTFYNGVNNLRTYATSCSYKYGGYLEVDKTVGYISLENNKSKKTQLEKLQISFNIPWGNSFEITNFFLMGLTPNSLPIVKKGLISIKPLTNLENFKDDLKLTPDELMKMQYNNGWILENKNYAHFFYDK